MGFNLLREAPQGVSEVPSSASFSGLYWEEGVTVRWLSSGRPWEPRLKVCTLSPEVSPFNPPRGVLQCRPPRALYCAQSLGRGPCDPAPLSEPQFPQDLSFPLLLTPANPVLHRERSAETRGGGGAKLEGTVASVRPSICLW